MSKWHHLEEFKEFEEEQEEILEELRDYDEGFDEGFDEEEFILIMTALGFTVLTDKDLEPKEEETENGSQTA